jgi:hypothetical protein
VTVLRLIIEEARNGYIITVYDGPLKRRTYVVGPTPPGGDQEHDVGERVKELLQEEAQCNA